MAATWPEEAQRIAARLVAAPLVLLGRAAAGADAAASSELLVVVKRLYDAGVDGWPAFGELPALLVDGFDGEQIWEELQLRHRPLLARLRDDVAALEQEAERAPAEEEDDGDDDDGSALAQQDEDESGDENEDEQETELEGEDDDDEDDKADEEEEEEEAPAAARSKSTSAIDDDFFSLHEMHKFVDDVEREEMDEDDVEGDDADDADEDEEEEEIDYFQDVPDEEGADEGDEDDDEDEDGGPKSAAEISYRDFFEPPRPEKRKARGRPSRVAQAVDAAAAADEDDGLDADEDGDDDNDNDDDDDETPGKRRRILDDEDDEEDDEEAKGLSKYERKLRDIRKTIAQLEEDNLQKRSWQLMGEASARDRPVNSLLEEVLEFDQATKGVPLITEQVTSSLEDMIKKRILDRMFDDVVRKSDDDKARAGAKPAAELEHDKSKKSLSEIYEEAYLKQQQKAGGKPDEARDGAPQELHPLAAKPKSETEKIHVRIREQYMALCERLDALTNFRFTPALPEQAEMQIVSNVPAMVVEEKVPTAFSDANRLAPEEIYRKKRVVIAGQTEMSAAEKKRLRIKAKHTQKAKEKRRAAGDMKRLEKSRPGLGNKHVKAKLQDIVSKATARGNVKIIGDAGLAPESTAERKRKAARAPKTSSALKLS